MKRLSVLLVLLAACLRVCAQNRPEWENPQIIGINKEAVLREDCIWAERGFAVAKEQFAVRPYSSDQIAPVNAIPIIITNDRCQLVLIL